jgi:hypothetical protein
MSTGLAEYRRRRLDGAYPLKALPGRWAWLGRVVFVVS